MNLLVFTDVLHTWEINSLSRAPISQLNIVNHILSKSQLVDIGTRTENDRRERKWPDFSRYLLCDLMAPRRLWDMAPPGISIIISPKVLFLCGYIHMELRRVEELGQDTIYTSYSLLNLVMFTC